MTLMLFFGQTVKMSAANKILRTANAPTTSPDETELSVAQALIDLENNVPELKAELRPLQISAAREVDVRGGKKAIVIFVPVPQLKAFRKVQQRSLIFRLVLLGYIFKYLTQQTHP
jgi:small subunit ribosomal protein S7e